MVRFIRIRYRAACKKLSSLIVAAIILVVSAPAMASVESKTWPASDKAKQFVEDTVVIGFFVITRKTGRDFRSGLFLILQMMRLT